jgi:hypothetical protein
MDWVEPARLQSPPHPVVRVEDPERPPSGDRGDRGGDPWPPGTGTVSLKRLPLRTPRFPRRSPPVEPMN